MPVIGVLLTGNADPEVFMKGFREALREVGYIDGQNIRLEVRSGEGRASLLPEKAAELVRLKVDLIVTSQTPAVLAAKQATSDIPIVMASAGDPVATGVIASLARPGGNVTGMSAASAELAGKSLELIREVIPSARLVAVLANEIDPFTQALLQQISQGARALGFEIVPVMTRPAAPLEAAFEAMSSKRADAFVVQGTIQSKELFELAIKHRLPSFAGSRQVARSGGLMTLFRERCGNTPRGGGIRRQDPQGPQAGRSTGLAAHQVRTGHQSQDREGARNDHFADTAGARRRGDRVGFRHVTLARA